MMYGNSWLLKPSYPKQIQSEARLNEHHICPPRLNRNKNTKHWNTNASSRNLCCPIVGLTAMKEAGTKSDNVESFSNLGNCVMAECPVLVMTSMTMTMTMNYWPVEDTSRPWVCRRRDLKHSCKAPRCPSAHPAAWPSWRWQRCQRWQWQQWRWQRRHFKGFLLKLQSPTCLVQLFSNHPEENSGVIWWEGIGYFWNICCKSYEGHIQIISRLDIKTVWRQYVRQWTTIPQKDQNTAMSIFTSVERQYLNTSVIYAASTLAEGNIYLSGTTFMPGVSFSSSALPVFLHHHIIDKIKKS